MNQQQESETGRGFTLRRHRDKKVGPYECTNAYTQNASMEQVLTAVAFLCEVTLYSIFVAYPLFTIRQVILWVLFGCQCGLLLMICFDYLLLTINDPVDRLILNRKLAARFKIEDLIHCCYCDTNVQQDSHHCMRCNRCTERFDHHCKFLNNCIGGRNYEQFIRLLSCTNVFCLNAVGQAVWVYICLPQLESLLAYNCKWGLLVTIALCSVLFIAIFYLEVFHWYLSCIAKNTTFGLMYPEPNKQKSSAH